MQTILQQPQQPMPGGSSESNFVPIDPTPETIVSPEQLAAADTASARQLVDAALGITAAAGAETVQSQPNKTQQGYIDAIAPVSVNTGNVVAEAKQVVTDTEVIRDATTIGSRLLKSRAPEISLDVQQQIIDGDFDYAA